MSSSDYTSFILPIPSQNATHSFLDCVPIGGSTLVTLPSTDATLFFGPRTTVQNTSTIITSSSSSSSSSTVAERSHHHDKSTEPSTTAATIHGSTITPPVRGNTVCVVGIRSNTLATSHNHSSPSSSSSSSTFQRPPAEPAQTFRTSSPPLQLCLLSYDLDHNDMNEYSIRPLPSTDTSSSSSSTTLVSPATTATTVTSNLPPLPSVPDSSWVGEQIPVVTKDSAEIVLIGTPAERIDKFTLPALSPSSSLSTMSIFILHKTFVSLSAARLSAIASAKTAVEKMVTTTLPSSSASVSAPLTSKLSPSSLGTSVSVSPSSFTIQPIRVRTMGGHLPARCGAAMCLLRKTRIVIFGGISRQSVIQEYMRQYSRYKPKFLTETDYHPPSSSSSSSSSTDEHTVADAPVYLNDFGYITWTNTTPSSSSSPALPTYTAEYKSLEVSRMIGKPPSPRAYASLVETTKTKERGYMVLLYGGYGPNGVVYTDIHCALLGKDKIVWTTPYITGGTLIPRIKCTLQIAEETDTLIIFGGAQIDNTNSTERNHRRSSTAATETGGTPRRGNRAVQQQTEKLGKLSAARRGSLSSSESLAYDTLNDKYMGLPVTTITLIDISKACLESPPSATKGNSAGSNGKEAITPPTWTIMEQTEPHVHSLDQMIQYARKASLGNGGSSSTGPATDHLSGDQSSSTVFPGYLYGSLSVLLPPNMLRQGTVQNNLLRAVTKGLPSSQWPADVGSKVYNLLQSALSCVVIARINTRYNNKIEAEEPTKKRINVPKVLTKANKEELPSAAITSMVTRPTGLFTVSIVSSLQYAALRSGLTMPLPLRGKALSTLSEPYPTGVKDATTRTVTDRPVTKKSSSVYSYDETEIEQVPYVAPIDSRPSRSNAIVPLPKTASIPPPPPPPTLPSSTGINIVQKLVQRRGIQGPPPAPYAPVPTVITGGSGMRGTTGTNRFGRLQFTSSAPSNSILGIRLGQRDASNHAQAVFNEVLFDGRSNPNHPPSRSTRSHSHAREVPLSQPTVMVPRSNHQEPSHQRPSSSSSAVPHHTQEAAHESDGERMKTTKPQGKGAPMPRSGTKRKYPSRRNAHDDDRHDETEEEEEDEDNDIQELNDSTSYTNHGRKGVTTTASSTVTSPVHSERYVRSSMAPGGKGRESKPVETVTNRPSSAGRTRRTAKSVAETVTTAPVSKNTTGTHPPRRTHYKTIELEEAEDDNNEEEEEAVTQEIRHQLPKPPHPSSSSRNLRSSTGRKRPKLQTSLPSNESNELSPIPPVNRKGSSVITRSQSRKAPSAVDVSLFEPFTNNTASTMDENDELEGLGVLSPSKSVRKTRQSTFRSSSDTKPSVTVPISTRPTDNTTTITTTIAPNQISDELLRALEALREDIDRVRNGDGVTLSSSSSLRSDSGRKGSATKPGPSLPMTPLTVTIVEKLDALTSTVMNALDNSFLHGRNESSLRTDTVAIHFTQQLQEILKRLPLLREEIRNITNTTVQHHENEITTLREELDQLRKRIDTAEKTVEEKSIQERVQRKEYETMIEKAEKEKQIISHERDDYERRLKSLEEQYLVQRTHAENTHHELRRLRKVLHTAFADNSNTMGSHFDPGYPLLPPGGNAGRSNNGNSNNSNTNVSFVYYPTTASTSHGRVPDGTVGPPWEVTATNGAFPSSSAAAVASSVLNTSTASNTANMKSNNNGNNPNPPPPLHPAPTSLTSSSSAYTYTNTVNPLGIYPQPPQQPLTSIPTNQRTTTNAYLASSSSSSTVPQYSSSAHLVPTTTGTTATYPVTRKTSISVEAPDGLSHYTATTVANVRVPATVLPSHPSYPSHPTIYSTNPSSLFLGTNNHNPNKHTDGENNPPAWITEYGNNGTKRVGTTMTMMNNHHPPPNPKPITNIDEQYEVERRIVQEVLHSYPLSKNSHIGNTTNNTNNAGNYGLENNRDHHPSPNTSSNGYVYPWLPEYPNGYPGNNPPQQLPPPVGGSSSSSSTSTRSNNGDSTSTSNIPSTLTTSGVITTVPSTNLKDVPYPIGMIE